MNSLNSFSAPASRSSRISGGSSQKRHRNIHDSRVDHTGRDPVFEGQGPQDPVTRLAHPRKSYPLRVNVFPLKEEVDDRGDDFFQSGRKGICCSHNRAFCPGPSKTSAA